MKIGIVAPFNPASVQKYFDEPIPAINKMASSVNNLVLSFLETGHSVCVFTMDNSLGTRLFVGKRIKIYVVGSGARNVLTRSFPSLRKLAGKLIPYVQNEIENLEVIHAQWCYEYALAAEHFIGKKPVFCTCRDIAPVIFKNMTIDGKLFRLLNKLYWAYRIRIFNKVVGDEGIHFVANSEYTKDFFTTHFPKRPVDLIYNSIEDSNILSLPKVSAKPFPEFISISTDVDDKRKNIYTLIEAFALLKRDYLNARLVLVGHCRKNQGIYQKALKNDLLSGVEFIGMLPRPELISAIDRATCLVHPAVEETFGNTLIEGMARCVPVIGGENSGAVPFVLDHGHCGLLCDIMSPESICAAMKLTIDSPADMDLMVKRATEKLKNTYSNTVVCSKHIDMYKKSLSI